MRHPPLNSLRMFDAAARHLNFRLAAEEMNLTQGAVAQQVRGLEESVGQPLFHRRPRGLELTEAGAQYHHEIGRALKIIDRATEDLLPQRRVTLSVPPSLATKWLLPRLPFLTHAHPEIDLKLVASETVTVIPGGEADLAIRQGRRPQPQEATVDCLAPMDLVAVTAPGSAPLVETIEGFRDLPLIEDGHQSWTEQFRKQDAVPPTRMLNFNQSALATDAAANGQGYALAPRLLVQDDLNTGRLVCCWAPEPVPGQGFYLICPRPPALRPEVQIVADWLLAQSGL